MPTEKSLFLRSCGVELRCVFPERAFFENLRKRLASFEGPFRAKGRAAHRIKLVVARRDLGARTLQKYSSESMLYCEIPGRTSITASFGLGHWSIHIQADPELDLQVIVDELIVPVCHCIFRRLGLLRLHCSAVATGRDVAFFIGPNGRGKSTLAYLLCRRGLGLVADDEALLSAGPKSVHILTRSTAVSLDPETLRLLGKDRPTGRTLSFLSARQKWSYLVRKAAKSSVVPRLKPRWIFFPRLCSRKRARARRLHSAEALKLLLWRSRKDHEPFLDDRIGLKMEFEFLARVAEQCVCFELGLSPDFDQHAQTVLRILRGSDCE